MSHLFLVTTDCRYFASARKKQTFSRVYRLNCYLGLYPQDKANIEELKNLFVQNENNLSPQ